VPTTTPERPALDTDTLRVLLTDVADALRAVDATNSETLTDGINLFVNVAVILNERRSTSPTLTLSVDEQARDRLLLDILAEAWGSLDDAQSVVGDLRTIEFPEEESIEAARDELRRLEGEGEFRDIPHGYVDSLSDEQVRERLAELRDLDDPSAA